MSHLRLVYVLEASSSLHVTNIRLLREANVKHMHTLESSEKRPFLTSPAGAASAGLATAGAAAAGAALTVAPEKHIGHHGTEIRVNPTCSISSFGIPRNASCVKALDVVVNVIQKLYKRLGPLNMSSIGFLEILDDAVATNGMMGGSTSATSRVCIRIKLRCIDEFLDEWGRLRLHSNPS